MRIGHYRKIISQLNHLPFKSLGLILSLEIVLIIIACIFPPSFFFFSSRRLHTSWPRDWSSDVCSSDLASFFQVVGKGTDLVATYPGEYFHIPLLTLAVWAIFALIICVIGGSRGQTLGRKTVGIRVISRHTGRPLGGGSALLRGVTFNAIAAVPVVGWIIHLLLILNDSQSRQGAHDRLAAALVVPADVDPALARVHEATGFAPTPQGPAGVPWEYPGAAADQTHVINSPLARSLNAPPVASAPPAPLPAWLDRSGPSQPEPAPAVPAAPTTPPAAATPPAHATPPAPTAPPAAPVAPADPVATPIPDPAPTPPATPAGAPPSPRDDEVEMTRLVRPGQARRAYSPTAPEPVQARISVSDGQVVDIRGTTLVGRNPAPRPGERAVTLLSVKDPERSVSKTHIILGLDARGLWMADRTSTNGSIVTLADGQQIVCMPEQQVRVTPGAKIQVGNVVITVLPV